MFLMIIKTIFKLLALISVLFCVTSSYGTDYHVGPSQTYSSIGDVAWESLEPGDNVFIHWRAAPYAEKWVVGRSGTEALPIVISGVASSSGELPVVTGENATTRRALNYTNEERGLIKIGSSNIPSDTLPQYIVIENLDLRSARPPYSFADDNGNSQTYSSNAASIYVEKARHLTIRNCTIQDSGNGIFVGAFNGETQDILIEKNHIFDNGIDGSYYQHNTYTAAIGITYQYNHMGPLRSGAGGNNLKDRSAGLTVRYNWIENGNRQLDLVDAEDSENLVNNASYHTTYVYSNILLEADGEGNSQMVHYGGDSGTYADYRKGTLYFFNNTLVSTRSGNTTMFRLSTGDETAVVFNNIVHVTAGGSKLALADENGQFVIDSNWFTEGFQTSHGSFSEKDQLTDDGDNIVGSAPGFANLEGDDYQLQESSSARDSGLNSYLGLDVSLPDEQYVVHQDTEERSIDGSFDIGAFEYGDASVGSSGEIDLIDTMVALQVLAGGETALAATVSDVDGDRKIGIAEAIEGLQAVSRSEFSPVALESSVTSVQPMTGIVFWDDSRYKVTDAIQLEYRYVGFNTIVTGDADDPYDWSSLESRLDGIVARGHQAVLRFYFVYPGSATTVPQYIKNLDDYEERSGTSEGLFTWFPDWSNSVLENFVLDFYQALASRYDNDPRLAFLQVGFGLWGEYHIYDGPMELGGTFPSKEFQQTFFNHMSEQFDNLKWSISIDAANTGDYSPFAQDGLLDLQFGLFDDSFNHEAHDDYNKDCFNFFTYTSRYLQNPMGGELSYYTDTDQENALSEGGPNGVSFKDLAEEYHISYMIGNDQPDYYTTMDRIEEAGMATGYRFKITALEKSSSTVRGTIKNTGIAPIYYDSYVAVNGVRSSETLKGLEPGGALNFSMAVETGDTPIVTIECDRLVAGQKIEYDADL